MTHVHEDLGAFVLGALDEDAERRVREHLATCAECRVAHGELSTLPELLDLAVVTGATETEPLPPALEERLLDRFAREHVTLPPKRRWRPRLALALPSALVGAAIAVAALVLGLGFERGGSRPASQYEVAFQKVAGAPAGVSARAGLRSSAAGTVVRLWVDGLPPADVYEVWCDARTWSAAAGTFRVDATGSAYVVLTTAVKRGQYDRIRLVRREHLAGGRVVPSDILTANLS